MKTIKNTNSFYVLGVKFENIQEGILYAIKGWAKNGVYVGKDAKLYPCFDSEDYASEDRFFWNIVFARSKEELDRKLVELKSISGAPDKPCGVGRADANPKLLLNDT